MLNPILATFNSREIALLIWIFAILIYGLINKTIRNNLFNILKMMFFSKLAFVFGGTILYAIASSFFLSKLNLWNILLIKDTIFWVVGSAFVLLFGINKATSDLYYFRKLLLSIFALSFILEYITNLYTFNIFIEMLLIPVFILIGGMIAISESQERYKIVKSILNYLLVLFGAFSFFYAFIHFISSFTEFIDIYYLQTFLIGPILTLGYIPFLYMFVLVMAYETLFVRIDMFLKKDKSLSRYFKWKILKICNFNLAKLIRFVDWFDLS